MSKNLINPSVTGLAYLLGLMSVFLFFSVIGARRLYDSGQPHSVYFLGLNRVSSASQSFTPLHNGLNVVRVYLKNVSIRNHDPLSFTLTDSTGQVVSHIDLNGSNVGDGDSVRFQFPPLPDSAGRTFTFTLTAPTTETSTEIGVGFTDDTGTYPAGLGHVGRQSGELNFDLYYRPQNIGSLLVQVLSLALSRILDLPSLVIATLVGLLWYFLAKRLLFDR